MKTPTSNCCNAKLVIFNGRDGTNHYICGACNHACDAKSPTPVKVFSTDKHSTGTPTTLYGDEPVEIISEKELEDGSYEVVSKVKSPTLSKEAEKLLPVNPCDNCENPNQMRDKRCGNCSWNAGYNAGRKKSTQSAILAERDKTMGIILEQKKRFPYIESRQDALNDLVLALTESTE